METQYFVWAGLAILFVASLVIAYYSSRTWSVGQVVLVYCIFLAATIFVYLAARTLKIRDVYGQQAAKLENQLKGLRQDITKTAADIGRLRHDFDKLTATRGGVWPSGKVVRAAADGTLVVELAPPGPQSIKQDSVLFLFALSVGGPDQGKQPPRYFGEFKVAAVDEAAHTVTLTPALDLSAQSKQALASIRQPVSLFDVMPIDRHDLFAGLPAAQLRAALPASSAEEYLRDGKPPKADDPSNRVLGKRADGTWVSMEVLGDNAKVEEKRYVRQLRDYQLLFRELARQRAVDRDEIAQAQHDAQLLKEAQTRAEQDVTYREAEKTKLTADLLGFDKERRIATGYLQVLQAQYANLKSKLTETRHGNLQLASQLARVQLAATQRIDQQTATP
jgi:hypothetical protein